MHILSLAQSSVLNVIPSRNSDKCSKIFYTIAYEYFVSNPFQAIGLFLYPRETSEVFWCFQEFEKETSGMKRVKWKTDVKKTMKMNFL